MNKLEAFLEKTWDGILSREEVTIKETFASLDPESKKVVFDHLHKMAAESGWHPEQVISAQTALQVLEGQHGS